MRNEHVVITELNVHAETSLAIESPHGVKSNPVDRAGNVAICSSALIEVLEFHHRGRHGEREMMDGITRSRHDMYTFFARFAVWCRIVLVSGTRSV